MQGLYLEAIVSLSLEIPCSLLDPYPELANDYLGLCVLSFGGEGKLKKSSSQRLQSALVLRSVFIHHTLYSLPILNDLRQIHRNFGVERMADLD